MFIYMEYYLLLRLNESKQNKDNFTSFTLDKKMRLWGG